MNAIDHSEYEDECEKLWIEADRRTASAGVIKKSHNRSIAYQAITHWLNESIDALDAKYNRTGSRYVRTPPRLAVPVIKTASIS